MSPGERKPLAVEMTLGGMIALPGGVTIHTGGRMYAGEIPAHLCPERFRPASEAKKIKADDGDQSAGTSRK